MKKFIGFVLFSLLLSTQNVFAVQQTYTLKDFLKINKGNNILQYDGSVESSWTYQALCTEKVKLSLMTRAAKQCLTGNDMFEFFYSKMGAPEIVEISLNVTIRTSNVDVNVYVTGFEEFLYCRLSYICNIVVDKNIDEDTIILTAEPKKRNNDGRIYVRNNDDDNRMPMSK